MPFKGWFGIVETARQFKKIDIGVANVARKVKAIWIGDENNLARKIIFLSISAPTNLKVNGLTSDSDSYCTLTWTAATITGAAGITYYIYRNGVQVATTTSTSYTFTTSTISSWSGVTLTVKAYNETTGFSDTSNAVTYTYVQPITLTAPTNLKVNGSTSSTSSSCRLTWTASTLSGATGTITYYIYKDNTQVATTTSTSYTFGTSTISGWSSASLKIRAYNSSAGYSAYTSTVTFTYKAASAKLTVNASKYADTYNSSYANTGTSASVVGRSTTDAPVGTALQFLAPSGGWSQYSKAVLYVQRTGGSASGNVRVHKLTNAYSGSISALQAYYGNVGTSIGTVAVAGGTGWFSIDVSSFIPSSGEFAVTLVCRDSYMTVDGTTAYIQLTA